MPPFTLPSIPPPPTMPPPTTPPITSPPSSDPSLPNAEDLAQQIIDDARDIFDEVLQHLFD